MERFCSLALIIVLSAVVAGCNSAGTGGRKKAVERLYEVKGKVVAIDEKKPSVKLDHEDIPGLMRAMTMEFPVESARVLEGIGMGDAVQGQLRKDESGYVVTRLEKR